MIKKLLPKNILIFSFLFSMPSFAVCEKETNELVDWNDRCEKAAAASQVAGTVGGVLAKFTFGASLVPCAVLIAVARNSCQIRDEKRNNLLNCQKDQQRIADEARAFAEKNRMAEKERQKHLSRVDEVFNARRNEIIEKYKKSFEAYVANLRNEGWDLGVSHIQEEVNVERKKLETERDQKISQTEEERINILNLIIELPLDMYFGNYSAVTSRDISENWINLLILTNDFI